MEKETKSMQKIKKSLSESNNDVSQSKLKKSAPRIKKILSKNKKDMMATRTFFINKIWGDYYSLEEDPSVGTMLEEPIEIQRKAIVVVAEGNAVLLEVDDGSCAIVFVEYMFERSEDMCKMLHGRILQRGSKTILGDTAANEMELFLTNECMTVELKNVKGTINFKFRTRPWGHQYRKDSIHEYEFDRERKAKGLPIQYYCKSLYCPERGGFFSLPLSEMCRGYGSCGACKIKEDEKEKRKTKLNSSNLSFSFDGIEYSVKDYLYVSPKYIPIDKTNLFDLNLRHGETFRCGRNIGLRAFGVCQLLEIIVSDYFGSFLVKLRKFYRPEDVSIDMAYISHIQEIYYSEETIILPLEALKGKCDVRKRDDMPSLSQYPVMDNIFFCECLYDPSNGSLTELPINIKMSFSTKSTSVVSRNVKLEEIPNEMRLATLDIFSGCGGLSQGLEQTGVCETKWAIEYEKKAGEAFRKNHPKTMVFIDNCNVILRAIMEKCGDGEECISTSEAFELASKLKDDMKNTLPLPGQVDFICGGPPCQGFSKLNRFNQSSWSQVQSDMILAFLSFADYYRPKYFLLENVKEFVSFNKGRTFQLTIASLLEMGYQVRFGILEAGAYGVPQSRKRAFIWACSPEEIIPEWPEPMHVFRNTGLKIPIQRGLDYAAVPCTGKGAPFRSITVKDTIFDLPQVQNGESSKTNKEYNYYVESSISWFQKHMRKNMMVPNDHICKKLNEINYMRCKAIPKRPGADWRNLPNKKVNMCDGKVVDFIPRFLKNRAKKHCEWKGLYGRLDWLGNFPTSVTNPQPMGKVGMCFHPEQDRILTVREYARSQGLPDTYKFSGKIHHKHRQIGNAVPPPLAFALGHKLKQALFIKSSLQHYD